MSPSFNQPPPDPHSSAGHEQTDVNPLSIGLFGFVLAVSVAFVLLFLVWLFWHFESVARQSDQPLQSTSDDVAFKGPRLQNQPTRDFVRFRQAEHKRLSSYGWIDRQQGIVQIPIQQAIQLLAERGLPEPLGMTQPNERGEEKP